MFDFIQKLTSLLLGIQETFLPKSQSFAAGYSNKTSKKIYTNSASLELTSKTQTAKTKTEEDVKTIVKKCQNNPKKLLAFARKNGTKVYKINSADKILNLVGLESGLLSELNGFKAIFVNIITSISAKEALNIALHTQPMFVLDSKKLDAYNIIQQFYKWYAMKLNLPGFEENAQVNLQKFMTNNNSLEIKSLDISEILELKEAIARDAEAIKFVIELAKSTEGSKKALGKITLKGASV